MGLLRVETSVGRHREARPLSGVFKGAVFHPLGQFSQPSFTYRYYQCGFLHLSVFLVGKLENTVKQNDWGVCHEKCERTQG